MDLNVEQVEGELGIVIAYQPGTLEAKHLFQGAMRLIDGLEAIDKALLSSIDTSLEPVSILNDVQHSSLKILLARALRKVPDNAIQDLDWKKWVGNLLVQGKYKLLEKLESNEPVEAALAELKPFYDALPNSTSGYALPDAEKVAKAVNEFKQARASLSNAPVKIQTELGDIDVPVLDAEYTIETIKTDRVYRSEGRRLFKIKTPDFLGNSMWEVLMDGKRESVRITHEDWVNSFHDRAFTIIPHDSLDADFIQEITYNEKGEILTKVTELTYIHNVVPPVKNGELYD